MGERNKGRPPTLRLHADELIVDSFAGGGGASLGIEWALGRSPDIAINHDAEALAMHRVNHPKSKHLCENVWRVDPVKACRGKRVGLMWLSPDCKHHSKAKGGKPVDKKIRGLAWIACSWARKLGPKKPRLIVLENVEEFEGWGPLLEDGRPCPVRKGLTFRRFVRELENLGYVVEHRPLIAADFGAPTIRKRLFLIARCDGLPIVWPEPTHDASGRHGLPVWRSAAECIDFSIPCPSIFERAKPLANNTLRRIARGVKKFVIDAAEPFIVRTAHGEGSGKTKRWGRGSHPLREPLPTAPASNDFALVAPYITKFRNGSIGSDIAQPLHTVTAGGHQNPSRPGTGNAMGLVAPYLARIGQTGGNGDYVNSVDSPVTTITSKAEHLLVAPTLIQTGYGERKGQRPRVPGLGKPLGTVVGGGGKHALVAAFMAQHNGGFYDARGGAGRKLAEPISTITQAGSNQSLVASSLVKLKGSSRHGQAVTDPLHTVQAGGNHYAEVQAFLIKYYGTDQDPQLKEPLHTVTSKDRFGLVMVMGCLYAIVDICMRMLQPRELFRAQGFPDTYKIERDVNGKPFTKSAQVKMCGNSVSPPVAKAIIAANFGIQIAAVAA